MARYQRTYRGARSNRRKLVWARMPVTVMDTPGSVDLLENWRDEMDWGGTVGLTVRRIRIQLTINDNGTGDVFGVQPLVGIIRWNQDDSAGVPVLNSGAGRHADWMMFQQVSGLAQGGQTASYDIDVKSQRKLEEMRQTIFFEFTDPAGASAISFASSVLLALP